MTFILASELAKNPVLLRSPEVLPGSVCAIGGRSGLVTCGPKGGKSSTAAAIIAAASVQGVMCALLCIDESPSDALQRLIRCGADLTRVYIIDAYEPETLGEQLESACVELLILDNLLKLAQLDPEFTTGNQGDPVLWGRKISPFTSLAHDTGLSVLLLDQARRSDGKYSGSFAKAGSVDMLLELVERDGGLDCTPRGRMHLPPFRLELDADGVPRFVGVAPAVDAAGPAAADSPAARELLQFLADSEPEGLTSSAWLKMSGQPKTSFNRHRRALLRAHLVLPPDATRTRRYRVTDAGESALVPQVPNGAIGTMAPLGRNGAIGTTTLLGVVPGTSQAGKGAEVSRGAVVPTGSEEEQERLAIVAGDA